MESNSDIALPIDNVTLRWSSATRNRIDCLYTIRVAGTDFENYYLQNIDAKFKKDTVLYFVQLANPTITYELDWWTCFAVSQDKHTHLPTASLELRDSSKPATNCSERMHRMHETFTANITNVLLKNLVRTAQPIKKRKTDAGPDDIEEVYQKTFPLPRDPSSPYAVRISQVRQSIYNAGMSSIEEFDEKTRNWEMDAAANDLASWVELVKAMVTAVTSAVISTKHDERKLASIPLREMVDQKIVPHHHKNYRQDDFLQEAAMAALWDLGLTDTSTEVLFADGRAAFDTAKERWEQMAETDQTVNGLRTFFEDPQVEEFFSKEETMVPSNLQIALEQRKQRVFREIGKGPPLLATEAHHAFVEQVWKSFEQHTAESYRTPVILHAYSGDLPMEGLGYVPPNLQFGICNIDNDGDINISLGHGAGLMVEATEIAVGFLQNSSWARTTRARSLYKGSTPTDCDIDSGSIKPTTNDTSFPHEDDLEKYCVAFESHLQCGIKSQSDDLAATSGTAYKKIRDHEAQRYFGKVWWKVEDSANEAGVKTPFGSHLAPTQVFYAENDNPDTERQTAFVNCALVPDDLGRFLANSFVGGVFMRNSLLHRPIFAKVVREKERRMLETFACAEGFVDLASVRIHCGANGAPGNTSPGVALLYASMRHEISEHTATGRRMNHLLQPFIVSVLSGGSNACRSYMTVESYWGPKRDFWAVEAECCFEIRQVLTAIFQNRGQVSSMEGTLGEKAYGRGFNHLAGLLDYVNSTDKRQTAAGIAVRLIEAVQSSNESVKDAGRVHRQKEARAHVSNSRAGYATLLVKVALN